MKSRCALGVAAALMTTPLVGLPAWGAPCVSAPVAVYTAAGFSCNVDGVTFSNIAVNTTVSNGGSVTLGNFTPVNPLPNEFGLLLNYTALAPAANSTADVSWSYNVTGTFINDAFLALAGNTTGSGQAQVSEVLSNGITLSLNAPGSTTATFAPVSSLFVMKDQIDFVGPGGGTSTSSALTNAFSLVPAPIVGAGLPGLVAACGGLLALSRRHRRRVV